MHAEVVVLDRAAGQHREGVRELDGVTVWFRGGAERTICQHEELGRSNGRRDVPDEVAWICRACAFAFGRGLEWDARRHEWHQVSIPTAHKLLLLVPETCCTRIVTAEHFIYHQILVSESKIHVVIDLLESPSTHPHTFDFTSSLLNRSGWSSGGGVGAGATSTDRDNVVG